MNYVAIIFDTTGKIVEARPFALPDGNRTTLKEYAAYVGYDIRITDTVYRGGNFAGTRDRALVIMGPVNAYEAAQAMACSIHGAAITVDTAKYLLEATR